MAGYQLTSNESTPLFAREMIESQQQRLSQVSRFPFMSFTPELESAFKQFRYQRLVRRIPIIGSAGLILFCVFSVLDLFTLPPAVAQISIPIRLFLICPLIALIMYLGARRVSPHVFLNVYFGVFLISGAAIIAIIYTADLYDFLLAYDGILLHLVFGYFVMSLPYTMAIVGGVIVSSIYLVMSTQMNLQVEQLASNSIFIIGLNFIGALGCYMQERARRFLFLNQQLVDIAKEKDRKEIESKTRLVAIASHDLKQPLHAMNLLIETLNDQVSESEPKEIVKSLAISTRQLSQLLGALLDISKLNAGIVEPKVETIDLSQKVSDCCQGQLLRFNEANIELSFSGDERVLVRADALLLERIIRNVIENIFVHAQATDVTISWYAKENKARLDIKDNGKGIPEEDLQTIFEEFQQSGEYTSVGMGLGLTIVKQLAELQNIDYGLASKVGEGSCFWFEFISADCVPSKTYQELVKITIVQSESSDFANKWSNYIRSWSYDLSVVSLQTMDDLEKLEQNVLVYPQILIFVMQGQEDIHADLEQIKKVKQLANQFSALLLVVDTKNTLVDTPVEKGLERVDASVRPAKLRLILEHLKSQHNVLSCEI